MKIKISKLTQATTSSETTQFVTGRQHGINSLIQERRGRH